jgi:hypothetical protein
MESSKFDGRRTQFGQINTGIHQMVEAEAEFWPITSWNAPNLMADAHNLVELIPKCTNGRG